MEFLRMSNPFASPKKTHKPKQTKEEALRQMEIVKWKRLELRNKRK